MGRKRKRPVRRPRQQSPQTVWRDRKKSSAFKRARVKQFIANGLTKKNMDQHRERYSCMKEHPGRYCRECNPRETGGDEEFVDWSEEEAELSETWSDVSFDECEGVSVTYSEAWNEIVQEENDEKERIAQEEEMANTTRFLKKQVAFVDDVAARLQQQLSVSKTPKPPVGLLQGRWNLYNVDICPKIFIPGERFTLFISKLATDGPLPPEFIVDRDHPLERYMQWQIEDKSGGVVPFEIPTHASLKSIPIKLNDSQSYPAEVVFLGSDCLRLRVPKDILEETDEQAGMVEFAGIRMTEAYMKERREMIKAQNQKMRDERNSAMNK